MYIPVGKKVPKNLTTYVIIKKLANLNNRPIGANSPNLVTLRKCHESGGRMFLPR
jgi:hypothetical protein